MSGSTAQTGPAAKAAQANPAAKAAQANSAAKAAQANPAAKAAQTSQVAKAAQTDGASDPSMEDILSSIRRILSEDEAGGDAVPEPDDDLLELDDSMRLAPVPPPPEPEPFAVRETDPIPPSAFAAEPQAPPPRPAVSLPLVPISAANGLLADTAARAAAASMGELVRSLGGERNPRLHSGGPTLEDMVIEAMRPLLKSWLDDNLPPMVERLVRNEIERVTSRVLGA